ncbi:preprotein translocase subunit TatB [Legionella israelensis]|uniref:Preprotein translocase subunit TatB n=1 Tax=Legionella israelensis TaxID=454 RepID=A0AAX1EDH4_9GAMM|nr:twin-arginine translocase TatA/TatE family subunit [Legionella israelensis]QBR83150.1 preprotein translocase subunit TatB [Legionella israelensis]
MSMAELLLILFVAVIVFGPSKLPMLARHLGLIFKKMDKLKQQANEIWQQHLKEVQLSDNTQKAQEADLQYHKEHFNEPEKPQRAE